jgi:hypothetical protein
VSNRSEFQYCFATCCPQAIKRLPPTSNISASQQTPPPLKHVTRSLALRKLDLHHKTLVCSIGGCILPDDVANLYRQHPSFNMFL